MLPARFDLGSPEILNVTVDLALQQSHSLDRRTGTSRGSVYWDLPMVSVPPGTVYQGTAETFINGPNPWQYKYDDTAGAGQFVYLLSEEGVWKNHDEFTTGEGSIETLGTAVLGDATTGKTPDPSHGSGCAAKIMGAKLGVCKKCTLVFCSSDNLIARPGLPQKVVRESIIQQMDAVLDDIISKGRVGKATVSMSFSYAPGSRTPQFYKTMSMLLIVVVASLLPPPILTGSLPPTGFSLNQLVIKGKVVLVASSNNHAKDKGEGRPISRYPALFGDPATPYGQIQSLITVGAVDSDTYEADFSQSAGWMTTYAPGKDVYIPDNPSGGSNAMKKGRGTSYGN